MRLSAAQFALLCLSLIYSTSPAAAAERRCGWFDNPTAGNAWLRDKDGDWVIAEQGGYQAKGTWPPIFTEEQWIVTNVGNHGYGCACMDVTTDTAKKHIVTILKSNARPASACIKDKTLPVLMDEEVN